MKTISTAKAIDKAMVLFNCAGLGNIRTIELLEGSGAGDKWTSIDIHIGYSRNGDYTESDANPFIARIKVYGDNDISVARV